MTNYEVGIKLDAMDRRLRSNFAFFFTDYEDIQVTTVVQEQSSGLGLPLPAIQNAGKAEIKGVEGEITFMATQYLRFMLNFAYTDGRYLEYTVDSSVLGTSVENVDRSDEPMPRLADWTGFLSADYTIMTDDWGMIVPSINLRYSDEIYHGFDRDSYLTTLAGGDLVSEEVVFVGAKARGAGIGEQFHYTSVTWCAEPSLEGFLAVLEQGDVIVELRMHVKATGGGRNHGTAFRIRPQRLGDLYEVQMQCRPLIKQSTTAGSDPPSQPPAVIRHRSRRQ